MNRHETGLIVGRFESNYTKLATEDLVNEWVRALHKTDPADASAAADMLIEAEKFFPSVATFRSYLTAVVRATPKVRDRSCERCGGSGWVAGPVEQGVRFPSTPYETVKPCEDCSHEAYEQWRVRWSREARVHRRDADEPTYEVDPEVAKDRVRELRGFLADLSNLTRNIDALEDPDHA